MNRRSAPTSPSRVILSQHLNPFYFDFTKNHCQCCPHDDPLLILFQLSSSSISNTEQYKLNTKKSSIIIEDEYRKLIDEAIIQYEKLEIESTLSLLKKATKMCSNCPELFHFLAPLLHAQVLGDTIHDETLRNELLSSCSDRLDQALIYLDLSRKNYKQTKLLYNNIGNMHSNGTNNGKMEEEMQFSPQSKLDQSFLDETLKRIEFWIDSVEHYVRGNFEGMKKSSTKGISLGEEVYSKMNCSTQHNRITNRNTPHLHASHFSHHPNMDLVSIRKLKDNNQQNIFQHNFEKDINFIYQHYRDVTMGELWRMQYIASKCQHATNETVAPDQLRMQYRYLCKSMAFGNLVPSRVLCQLALVCNSLEQLFNGSTVSKYQHSLHSSSSDEELMLRAKIHDLVFHESGLTHGKKMNMSVLKPLKESNIFSKKKSPRESPNSSISLPEQYFQDSFLLNGRGSFCGSVECALGESSLISNNLTKVMKLFNVEGKFNPVLLSILGYCLYKDGEDKRSEALNLRAMSIHPNNFSIYKSMNEKFYLLCYRFFLLSEEKFVEQVEVLFKRILNMALERSTSDRLIFLVRGQQRCFLSLIPNYYDNSIDIEQREDDIQRTIESLNFYNYLSPAEQIEGLVCKYTKRMRENLLLSCGSFASSTMPFTDLTCITTHTN